MERRWMLALTSIVTLASLGALAGGCGTANAVPCAPGQQISCSCPGDEMGIQACKADGSGFEACACNGSSGSGGGTTDDNSPFENPPADGTGTASSCGTKVGAYRNVGSYSNGSTWAIHGKSELATCQGAFPTPLAYASSSADACAGSPTLRTPDGIAYQCVEYVRRFYVTHYAKKLQCSGNAVSYWKNPDALFDVKMENGSTTTLPQADDVIVFATSALDKVGHIALVRRVSATTVYIIQQNVMHSSGDESYPLALSVDSSGKVTVKDAGGYLGSYGVLGWLRSSSLDPLDCSSDLTCPDGYACQGDKCVISSGSSCGDGAVNAPEACDGSNLQGQTCASKGFNGGMLTCQADCTLNTSACCKDQCTAGKNQCSNPSTQQTCVVAGTGCAAWGGDTQCSNGCVAGSCQGGPIPACGNGVLDPGESCDGFQLGGATCQSQGHDGGTLKCTNCIFDTSSCCSTQFSVSNFNCPSKSSASPGGSGGGEIFDVCGQVDATGFVTIKAWKHDGSTFGNRPYQVRVSAPGDGPCGPANNFFTPVSTNPTGVGSQSLSFAFQSNFQSGQSDKEYCVTASTMAGDLGYDPSSSQQKAWWYSQKVGVLKACQ